MVIVTGILNVIGGQLLIDDLHGDWIFLGLGGGGACGLRRRGIEDDDALVHDAVVGGWGRREVVILDDALVAGRWDVVDAVNVQRGGVLGGIKGIN